MNAFLCLCVIMIHVASAPTITFAHGSLPYILLAVVGKLLCFAVPGFIFLSGFKLYNKYQNSKLSIKSFYTGRLISIVLPYIGSVLIYFLYYYQKDWVLITELPQHIYLGTVAAHFYYIIIAVQFYLVFPLLMPIFRRFPKTFTAISFIATVYCLMFFNFTYSDRFIGTYIFYFALGMLFSEYKLYKKCKKICALSIIATIILGAVNTLSIYTEVPIEFIYKYPGAVYIAYVTCAIIAIFTLTTICGKKSPLLNKTSRALSNASYDIYLYHILVMAILQYDVFLRLTLTTKEKLLIMFVVVFGLTFVYAAFKNLFKRRSVKK